MTPSFCLVRTLITIHHRVAARMDYVSTDCHVLVRAVFGRAFSSVYKDFLRGEKNSEQNILNCQWKERDGSFHVTRMFVGPHDVNFISVSKSAGEKGRNFPRKSGYKKLIFDLAYLKDVSIITVTRILRFNVIEVEGSFEQVVL